MRRQAVLAAALAAAASLAGVAATAPPVPAKPKALTASLAEDYNPTVSPDGRWLVHVSTRDGNRALLALRLDRPGDAPIPVAPHPADSIEPAFSPDGRRLAFVTTRENALGAVWVMDFPNGKPRPIRPNGLGRESRPAWLGNDRISLIEVGPGGTETRLVLGLDGKPVAGAPKKRDRRNDLPFNVIRENSDLLVLALRDTNGDGRVDGADDGSVWRRNESGGLVAVADAMPGLTEAVPAPGGAIVTASPSGNRELFLLAAPGGSSAGTGVAVAREAEGAAARGDLDAAAVLWRSIALGQPGTPLAEIASLEWIRCELGATSAAGALPLLKATGPAVKGPVATARHRLLVLRAEVAAAIRHAPDDVVRRATLGRVSTELERVLGPAPPPGLPQEWLSEARLSWAQCLAALGDRDRALEEAAKVAAEGHIGAEGRRRAEALLLRSRVFASIGLADEALGAALDAVLSAAPGSEQERRAGDALMSLAEAGGGSADERIIAIRSYAAEHPGVIAVQALARRRVAALLTGSGRASDAAVELEALVRDAETRPGDALEAAEALARLKANAGDHDGAVRVFDDLIAAHPSTADDPVAAAAAATAREGLIRQLVDRGREELRLNDAALAARTFDRVLELDGGSIAGWRGRVAAQAALPGELECALPGYRREARARRDDALAWYRLGLALTYRPGSERDAVEALQRAVNLRGDEVFHHQTLGFALEARARRTRDNADDERAWSHYEQALALESLAPRPQEFADLLLNCANAAMRLQRFDQARLLYERRDQQSAPFENHLQGLLFRMNFGVAAFRSYWTRQASRQLGLAVAMLDDPTLRFPEALTPERRAELRRELVDRRALALAENGAHAEAAALYEELANVAPEGSMDVVRALRGAARALVAEADGEAPERERDLLALARDRARHALSLLPTARMTTAPAERRGGALFDIDVVIAANKEEGAATTQFERADEERVLRGILAEASRRLGDEDGYLLNLRAMNEALPPGGDTDRAARNGQRAATLSRIADVQARAGERREAARTLLDALASTRFTVKDETLTNMPAATHLWLRLAELAAADPAVVSATELRGAWPVAGVAAEAPVDELLVAGAETLLAQPAAASSDTADSRIRCRALMASVLALEAHASRLLATDGGNGLAAIESGLRAAELMRRAADRAKEVARIAAASSNPTESNRLALLAQGAAIRIAAGTRGDSGPERAAATAFAEATGQHGLVWWLEAQEALAAVEEPTAAAAAERAARLLVDRPPAMPGATIPWELIDRVEARQLAALPTRSFEPVWDVSELWRAARLRLAMFHATPPTRGAEEASWVARMDALRRGLETQRAAMGARAATTAAPPGERRDLATAESAIAAHLAKGVELGLAPAQVLGARPMPLADATAVLEAADLLPAPAALVLWRELPGFSWRGAMTLGGERSIDDAGAAAWVGEAPLWFVMGEGPTVAPRGARVVRPLNAQTLAASIATFPLVVPSEPAVVTADGPTTPTLALAGALSFEASPSGPPADPSRWRVGGGAATLGEVLVGAPNAVQATFPRETRDALGRGGELALAATLYAAGIRQMGAPDEEADSWLGFVPDPAKVPDRLARDLDMARGAALAALRANRPEQATGPLETLVRLKRAAGDKAELPLYESLLAQALGDAGAFSRAVEPGSRAVELLRGGGDRAALATALMRVGSDADRGRMTELAVASFVEAASIRRELGDVAGEREATIARGVTLENANRYDEALTAFDDAARLSELPLEKAAQMRRRARILSLRQNRFTDAEAVLQVAAKSVATNIVGTVDDETSASLARMRDEIQLDIARVEERTGRLTEAERRVRRVLDGGATGELRAIALLDHANVLWTRSDYLGSLRSQGEGMPLAREARNRALEIAFRNAEGLTHWAVNNAAEALRSFDAALHLAESEGLDGEVATSWNNRGLVLRSERRYAEALDAFARALATDRRTGSRWGEAYSLRNTGLTLAAMGEPARAVEPLREAVRLSALIGDRVNETKARLALADALRATAEPEEASRLYDAVLVASREIPLPEVEWRADLGVALLALARGDRAAATTSLDRSIERIETLRAAIRIDELQDSFLSDKQEPYDRAIRLALDGREWGRAFELSERSRGRNFIDLLGNRRIELGRAGDRAQLDREAALRGEVEQAQRIAGSATPADRPAAQARVEAARREYGAFLLSLRAANPELGAFVSVEPVALAEIQRLLDPATRLLEYHLLDDELVCFVVGPTSIEATRTRVRREDLAARIAATRARLQDFAPVDEELALLSRVVLQPVLPLLTNDVRRVGIVPHRELHAMPFAALPTAGPGSAMIDRVAVFHAPSASVLRYTFARRPEAGRGTTSVLALGNPDHGSRSLDLPFAQKEAERLQLEMPGTTLVTGSAATESWLMDNIGRFGVIHLATHGEYNPIDPMASSIMLAGDGARDGRLTAADVFSLGINADLVALSACQTGLGRLTTGDDIVGLNRAFVYAGTRQILSSLWRVDDVSTAVLVKHFYREMTDKDRAEALRTAQQTVRRRFPHPAHWAGMTLSGDYR